MVPSLRGVQARHWGLVGVASLISVGVGWAGPGGVILGGGLMSLSALLYAAGLRIAVVRAGSRLAIGLLFVKLLAFLGLGWLVLASGSQHRPDPIGFVIGLSCFPAAAVWEAMRFRGRS